MSTEFDLMANALNALDAAMERPIANEHDQTGYLPYLRGDQPSNRYAAPGDARIKELEDAARAVVWFDWSGNDSDAVAAIERLREALKP